MNKKKILNIAIIILGIITILIPAFHQNIWFDESYSVAIAKHSFTDIWNITGHDVHPALYYWMIHIVYWIFGNNIIAFRLFSVLGIVILGIIGYTHIRKDFGEKIGILFSFLTFFLPIMGTYSREIRMYSWACLIVTLMEIYAYRLYKKIKNKQENTKQELILFGIFSLCSCYIHYYALVTAGLTNLFLLIYLIKNRKDTKLQLRNFLILAGIQIVLYIPWLIYFVGQLNHVSGGFWIVIGPINTTVEVLSFQFKRQIDNAFSMNLETIISLVAALLMYMYLFYRGFRAKKENKDIKPALFSYAIYVGVILLVLLVSIVSPILFSRYLFVMTGLYIFGMAFFMAEEKNKWITIAIVAIITVMSLISTVKNVQINYDESNMKQIEYLKERIEDDDIIIYKNYGNGGVIAAFFKDNKQYYYNSAYWDIEEAYKAYGPGMSTIYNCDDVLKDYHGRIWVIDTNDLELYNEIPKDGINLVEEPIRFETKYQDYIYNIILLEKE